MNIQENIPTCFYIPTTHKNTQQIMKVCKQNYSAGHPLVVGGHSLGSGDLPILAPSSTQTSASGHIVLSNSSHEVYGLQ